MAELLLPLGKGKSEKNKYVDFFFGVLCFFWYLFFLLAVLLLFPWSNTMFLTFWTEFVPTFLPTFLPSFLSKMWKEPRFPRKACEHGTKSVQNARKMVFSLGKPRNRTKKRPQEIGPRNQTEARQRNEKDEVESWEAPSRLAEKKSS